jgi:hypothetical protein
VNSGCWINHNASDSLPVCDPAIIRNNRLHSGCIFWQPEDFRQIRGGHPAQCKMGTTLVIVYARLDFAPCILQRHEPVLVQAFLPHLPLKDSTVALSVDVPGMRSGSLLLCHTPTCPAFFMQIQNHYRLSATVVKDARALYCPVSQPLLSNADSQTFSGVKVDNRPQAESSPVKQRIRNKIHAPDVVWILLGRFIAAWSFEA